jgi:hypothetical protein
MGKVISMKVGRWKNMGRQPATVTGKKKKKRKRETEKGDKIKEKRRETNKSTLATALPSSSFTL